MAVFYLVAPFYYFSETKTKVHIKVINIMKTKICHFKNTRSVMY